MQLLQSISLARVYRNGDRHIRMYVPVPSLMSAAVSVVTRLFSF
jgi:hypothetical protein